MCVDENLSPVVFRSGVPHSKLKVMSGGNEIEAAVLRLTPSELDAFRTWFAEFDAAAWDRQIEDDVAAGRLDALANEALEGGGPAVAQTGEAPGQSENLVCYRQLPEDIRRLADESY
jgi:hypothetical protein